MIRCLKRVCTTVLITGTLVAVVLVTGCASDQPRPSISDEVAPPATPTQPDLSTPESAIRSYADWISYAYRIMDSEVATHTFGPYEEVRVNSYVQYNLMEGRGIEQFLAESEYTVLKSTDLTATVAGEELWRYRYFKSDQTQYLGGPIEASYEVTYTVVKHEDGLWRVDKVEANRTDESQEPEPPVRQE